MLFGTLFGAVIIPGLYVVFASLAQASSRKRNKSVANVASH
jgi:hydrophobic/amphiphilic exporter-1 (mainly G- bacteria), HAE1 family